MPYIGSIIFVSIKFVLEIIITPLKHYHKVHILKFLDGALLSYSGILTSS